VAVASAGPYANHLPFPQADNHASTYLTTHDFTGHMLFMKPNQQCQSSEGNSG